MLRTYAKQRDMVKLRGMVHKLVDTFKIDKNLYERICVEDHHQIAENWCNQGDLTQFELPGVPSQLCGREKVSTNFSGKMNHPS